MNIWTSEDIAKILIQLDEMQLPFPKYALCREQGQLKLLGRGGSSEVYEAMSRSSEKKKYAMKIMGFRNHNSDSEFFKESVQVQKDIGDFQNYVVKIYDHTEIWVTLDEKDDVVSAVKEKPETVSRTTLKLQIVVMEKIPSVITRTKSGNIRMLPEALSHGDEKEILKLAYEIGLALKKAHNNNVLHRDVKLENVFYSETKKQYKLGDFGIAKKTKDGFAGTIAFTKGYAAPEVRSSEDRYDNTADIYSFGMMLYVLSNNLKFPDSNTYNVNSGMQYTPGYIVPEPECNISRDFYSVIAKACMYNPDDRYQSMDDMLIDIEKLMYDANLGFKIEHKRSSLVMGSIMLLFGAAAWKLTLAPDMMIDLSLWEYIFLAACLGKYVLNVFKNNTGFTTFVILCAGIYLMISSGFSWIKLLLLLCMIISSGTFSGYFSALVLIANFISIMQRGGTLPGSYSEYSWVAITSLSIAYILLDQYALLSREDKKITNIYYKKGFYWNLMVIVYFLFFLLGLMKNMIRVGMFHIQILDRIVDILLSINPMMIGLYGMAFCIFWIGREKLLMYIQKKQLQMMNIQNENEYAGQY
ncbi:protein kinase domain-containing protein [Oribacterium sp. FC2011]|uniref:protein kinase domain-containing protein n=1 Tax=Oribacterium sp. FC2011 TaxID=1408311 RepID=UPI0004E0FEDE|nr:protein kinase [Oribacterium sp. FC2011]